MLLLQRKRKLLPKLVLLRRNKQQKSNKNKKLIYFFLLWMNIHFPDIQAIMNTPDITPISFEQVPAAPVKVRKQRFKKDFEDGDGGGAIKKRKIAMKDYEDVEVEVDEVASDVVLEPEKKTRKPRAKVVKVQDVVKVKDVIQDEVVVQHELQDEVVPEKKTRKPRAKVVKDEVEEEAAVESVAVDSQKPKKQPRKVKIVA